ncbi:MAG TPA: tetratricopeptide repeat protein, partial [Nitrospirae bacterium]|nr:tetratricopeptide repeat protein [Nitrospirota bacterium]
VFIVYAQGLTHDFVYDDIPLIAENELIRSPANIPSMFFQEDMLDEFSTGYYRPLIPAMDALAYAVFGASPAWFHFLNIVYHLVATALVYFLALRVLGSLPGALFAAGLFGLHPANAEAVAWVTGKNNVLSGIFTLASVLCFLRYRDRGRGGALAASAGLLFLGTLSKEFALMTPFALLTYERLEGRIHWKLGQWRCLLAYAPLFAVVLVYLGMRSYALAGTQGVGFHLESLHIRMAAMADVLVTYLRLTFIPVKLNAFYSFELEPGPFTFLSAAGLAVLLLAAFSPRSRRLAGFPAAWFFLFLMPVMNIIPVSGSPMAERYMYLSLVGPALFCGALYARHGGRRSVPWVAACVVAIFAALTLMRVPIWKSDETLYTHMMESSPDAYKGWYNLGVTMYEQGRYDEARVFWERTVKVRPDMFTARHNLGVLYEKTGDYAKAEEEYRLVLAAKEMPKVYANLGNALRKQGRSAEARDAYRSAIRMDPAGTGPYIMLSELYEGEGRNDLALEVLEEAMKSAPGESEPYNRTGTILGGMGMYKEAGIYFRKALEVKPSCTQCRFNLKQIESVLSGVKGEN